MAKKVEKMASGDHICQNCGKDSKDCVMKDGKMVCCDKCIVKPANAKKPEPMNVCKYC
mgnify:CR=1 FL=1